ncbi:MAG: PTS sugar transporter subunit IIA [Angelakisella sp.]
MENAIQRMLKIENVNILDKVDGWRDAVRVAIEPLIKGGYVEPRYIQSVLENTLLYGPYYVLAPDLAVIHARSEQGVLHGQLAVTLLRQPVKFSPEGYDVRVLVTLAAEEPTIHNACLMRLAEIFATQDKIAAIANAQSVEELYGYFAV